MVAYGADLLPPSVHFDFFTECHDPIHKGLKDSVPGPEAPLPGSGEADAGTEACIHKLAEVEAQPSDSRHAMDVEGVVHGDLGNEPIDAEDAASASADALFALSVQAKDALKARLNADALHVKAALRPDQKAALNIDDTVIPFYGDPSPVDPHSGDPIVYINNKGESCVAYKRDAGARFYAVTKGVGFSGVVRGFADAQAFTQGHGQVGAVGPQVAKEKERAEYLWLVAFHSGQTAVL
jgi:hypothetical protein